MADAWRDALSSVTETVFPGTKGYSNKDRSRLMPVGEGFQTSRKMPVLYQIALKAGSYFRLGKQYNFVHAFVDGKRN